jgi:hypothetical protein
LQEASVQLTLEPDLKASPVIRPAGLSEWQWHVAAACLIVGVAALRLFYLASPGCPLDLAADEAHYWDWSRHLDWSYYSKGPLVAYLIRLGTETVGAWAHRLTGNEMLAVRLPAVCCGALLLTSLYLLTQQVFGRGSLALGVVAAALTLPIVSTGSTLMTIDAPYTCCWGWALVLGHRAIIGGARWAWPILGVVIALGILAKYTMILWLPSVAVFLLFSRAHRHLLWSEGFWLMLAIAGYSGMPILMWNAQHNWVTFRHVSGQAGLSQTEGIRWLGPLVFVGTQCALFLVYWFVAWAAALIRFRPWCRGNPGTAYLWWLSITTFAVFFLFSARTDEEPNWPVAAYLSGLVLAAAWIAEQLGKEPQWYRRLTIGGLATASAIGLGLTIVMHHTDRIQPLLLWVSGPKTVKEPAPLRRFDPTCRLKGWRYLAAMVDELRQKAGDNAIIAGTSWTLPGELGFYCAGHPTVYSIGPVVGDRHSQYDLWHPNPVAESGQFLGKTMIIVGDFDGRLVEAFTSVEPTQTFVHEERGEPIAHWEVTVCHGFRGFRQVLNAGNF